MEPPPPPEPAGQTISAYYSGDQPYSTARQGRISARLIGALGCWAAFTLLIVTILAGNSPKPAARAVALMGGILGVLWNVVGGLLQRRFRDPVSRRVQALPGGWRLKFVLFCTLLALAEEAITTGLTNLAPAFGVPYGQAYITASGNYLDVVCLHSVVVFVPMFACWAWLLARYDFHPNTVFVLFGLTGTFAEMSFAGPQALLNVGFWSYIYGLMIYLPAYSIPARQGLRPPRWWQYPLLVFFPVFWVIPVAGVVGTLHPIKIHFAPIEGTRLLDTDRHSNRSGSRARHQAPAEGPHRQPR